jgi:phosphohistidine phosphatase SixA
VLLRHSGKTRTRQTGELLAEVLRARLVQRAGLGPKDKVTATKEALERAGLDKILEK